MSTLEAGPRLNKWGVERDRKIAVERKEKQDKAFEEDPAAWVALMQGKEEWPYGSEADSSRSAIFIGSS